MSTSARFEVVVGVDGTGSSLHAVKWAAGEAQSRRGTLRLVHASMAGPTRLGGNVVERVDGGSPHADAVRMLEVALLVAKTVAPSLEVTTEMVTGSPAAALSTASRRSDLLVLGARGPGGCTGVLVGAIASALADRAACPVFIVRGRATQSGPVVAELSGSAADESVLAAAFDRAERAETSVLAIAACSAEPDGAQQLARVVLDDALAPYELDHPSVPVERSVVVCSPEQSLSAAIVLASVGAHLVVVGAHGANAALRGLVAASACCDDVHHTHCPVQIVRPAA